MDRLYLIKAKRFVDADPYRGREHSGYDYSQNFLVVAPDLGQASAILVQYLERKTRYRNWDRAIFSELKAGADLPLEKRLEILGEIFERIPQ